MYSSESYVSKKSKQANPISPSDMKNPDTAIWILECRRRHNLHLTPFAAMLGTTATTLANWENGSTRPTGTSTRQALIAAGKNVGMPDLPTSDKWGRGEVTLPSNLEEQFAQYFGS
jgi:DNA-binding transcriptional regulator YiaG